MGRRSLLGPTSCLCVLGVAGPLSGACSPFALAGPSVPCCVCTANRPPVTVVPWGAASTHSFVSEVIGLWSWASGGGPPALDPERGCQSAGPLRDVHGRFPGQAWDAVRRWLPAPGPQQDRNKRP